MPIFCSHDVAGRLRGATEVYVGGLRLDIRRVTAIRYNIEAPIEGNRYEFKDGDSVCEAKYEKLPD